MLLHRDHVTVLLEVGQPSAALPEQDVKQPPVLESSATRLLLGQTEQVDEGGIGPIGIVALAAP
jgi:hypothetical protein